MKALIDGDLLVYECAFGAEDKKNDIIFPFHGVAERIDKKIADILDAVGADEHTIYLTGKGNFRDELAVTKEYKTNRGPKPWHYANARAYLVSLGAVLVDGMEADDALAIEQVKHLELDLEVPVEAKTVICSRDKDLRQVPGWHYGWEAWNQPEYAMKWTDELGHLELIEKVSKKGKVTHQCKGDGLKFFYAQILMGDPTDTIPGLPGKGDVFAYDLLESCEDEAELSMFVHKAYDNDELMLEQGRLLWMTRELNQDGSPVLWEIYDEGGVRLL